MQSLLQIIADNIGEFHIFNASDDAAWAKDIDIGEERVCLNFT